MVQSILTRTTRTFEQAHSFVNEVRREVERAARDGRELPPRVRSVHERAGHATPEYRTIAIPVPGRLAGASPEILSSAIAQYFAGRAATSLMLALDAAWAGEDGEQGSVLIAEARDRLGTRLFYMQPFRVENTAVRWGEPIQGGWRDPGGEEMILDAAF